MKTIKIKGFIDTVIQKMILKKLKSKKDLRIELCGTMGSFSGDDAIIQALENRKADTVICTYNESNV